MRRLLLVLATLFCFQPDLLAQHPATPPTEPMETEWSAEKIDRPPSREIKFKHVAEPYEQRFDSKLLEQGYVAIVRLKIVGHTLHQVLRVDHDLLVLGQGDFMNLSSRSFSPAPLAQQFERIVKAIPGDRLPAAEHVEFFTAADTDPRLVILTAGKQDKRPYREFRILAPTAEVAEARAAALLTLLDLGFTRLIQKELFVARQEIVGHWRKERPALDEAQAKEMQVAKDLETYSQYTPAMLADLRIRRLQLEVDLAGLHARIAACEKLLADKNGPLPKVEEIKVAAEIELAGFEVRLTKADEFISKVTAKDELLSRQVTIVLARKEAVTSLRDLQSSLDALDQQLIDYAPLSLVDDEVLIQPLKWTN